jgi:hypothetical protein
MTGSPYDPPVCEASEISRDPSGDVGYGALEVSRTTSLPQDAASEIRQAAYYREQAASYVGQAVSQPGYAAYLPWQAV